MTTTFSDMNEAKQYVREALQEFAHEYDVDAIAAEITDWCNGELTMVVSSNEFWQIVMNNEC